MISGLSSSEEIPAIVLNESFGGLGVAAPVKIEPGREIDVELCVEMGGIRNVAFVRHASSLPSGCRLGLEWKAQAVSRCLRDLLRAEKASKKHHQLVRILPGGLSVMWKLCEAERWEQLIDSADRLRKEGAACQVHELSAPIERFQSKVRNAIETSTANEVVEDELNRLIKKCIEVIS